MLIDSHEDHKGMEIEGLIDTVLQMSVGFPRLVRYLLRNISYTYSYHIIQILTGQKL